jgi:Raf kinase inhibitor-like YbhB/YbcL family protein
MRYSWFRIFSSPAWSTLLLVLWFGIWGGCSNAEEGRSASEKAALSKGAKHMTIKLTSTAFTQGHPIPKKYTGEGADVSPALEWSGLPEGTKELALICDDPDAPTPEPWVHWVMYKIPLRATGLPEGVPRKPQVNNPAGALQGKNSWPANEATGYRGPMPPPGHGVHHYYFKLYALDTDLTVEPGLDKKALLNAIADHILAEGVLMGTYER